jgi:hypothetical protein
MNDSILRIDCPCCGAVLEVGLAKLKDQEAAREAAFRKSVELNRRKDEDLDRKFAGLLKQQKGRKHDGPPIREFDLD